MRKRVVSQIRLCNRTKLIDHSAVTSVCNLQHNEAKAILRKRLLDLNNGKILDRIGCI